MRYCRQSTLTVRQLIRHNSNRMSSVEFYHAGMPLEPYKMQSCTNAQPTILFIGKTKSMCAFTNCVNTTSSCWSIGKMCEDLGVPSTFHCVPRYRPNSRAGLRTNGEAPERSPHIKFEQAIGTIMASLKARRHHTTIGCRLTATKASHLTQLPLPNRATATSDGQHKRPTS